MKKNLLLLFLVLFCFTAFSQTGPRKMVRGLIFSDEMNEAVPLANIFNQSSGKRYVSNRQGYFRILVAEQDTVVISGIGYGTRTLFGYEVSPAREDDTVKVILKPAVYKLRDVNIVYSNGKRDSIARAAAEYLKNDPLLNNYDRILNRDRGGAMSPLTAMYESFSKAANDMVRFEEFLRYAEKQKAVDKRYNKKIIKRTTGLPDEKLDAFIMYCKLDRDFILEAAEYDLLVAIKKCGDDFKMNK